MAASFDADVPPEPPGIARDPGPHDILTGLPLREHFENVVAEMMAASPEVLLSVLRLSLDGLTIVNQTLGHAAGNSVIRAAAERLVRAVRPYDLVARLDGDEFAVLIQPAPTDEESIRIANRILDLVRRTYLINGEPVNIGVSIGIARSADDKHGAGVLRKANLARSASKASGRSGFCLYESEMERNAQANRDTEVGLRRTLALHELEVHYQPQFNFETNRLVGFEALVRWRHPEKGLVSPGEFMPIAEKMGAIASIGAWVLETACREATHWPPDLVVAVNASPSQFDTGRFVEWVQKALTSTGLPGERLEIEITEGILLRHDTANLKILNDLHSMKVHVAMDDFGTGYASLSQLALFPFDKIKIDQSLAGVNGDDLKRRAIVRAITSLGRSLGISTLAEGIETEGQLARLQQDGCGLVQGYLVGKPVPASELGPIISRWSREPALLTLQSEEKMNDNVYKLVYCSINRIQGSDAEVAAELKKILASSRANNPRMDITGGLLYNEGKFAQVLEGPREPVSVLFEKIQRDERHSDAIIIYTGSDAKRDFSQWSMAFAGNVDAGRMPATNAAFHAAYASSQGAGAEMLSLLRELVVRDDDPTESSV